MKRSITHLLTLAALMAWPVLARPAAAQDAALLDAPSKSDTTDLPGSREVFEKHLDALGGEQAIAKVKNLIMTGSIQMPAMGINGTMKIIQVKPDKMSTTMDLPQVGQQIQVFDGEIGWMGSPVMGMQKMSDEQAAQTKAQLAVESMEGFRDTFKKVKIVGKSDFDDAPAYEMEATSKNDDTMSMYFDVETGLMRGMKMVAKTPMGEIPMMIYTQDYQQNGPVKMAMRTIIKAGPTEMVMTIDDVKMDVEIPADTFQRPDGI